MYTCTLVVRTSTCTCMHRFWTEPSVFRMTSTVAGGKPPLDVAPKPWAFLSSTQREKRDVVELNKTVHLVTNIKKGGMVHRLAETSRYLPRDRRRSRCGWRVGSAVSNVYFTQTKLWPPCKPALLCSRCFASGGTSATETVSIHTDENDAIEN